MVVTERLKCLMDEGNLREAVQLCDQMLVRDPTRDELRIVKSRLLSLPDPELCDPDGAVRTLVEALDRSPSNAELHEALGDAYADAQGAYADAAREYRAAIECDPTRARSFWSLGRLLHHPGVEMDAREAIQLLKTASMLDMRSWGIHRDLGTLLWETGKTTHAATEYQNSLECVPPPDPDSEKQIQGWIQDIENGLSWREVHEIR